MTASLLWLIPFLPLVGFCVNGALSLGSGRGARGPARGIVAAIAVAMPLLSFVLVALGAVQIAGRDDDRAHLTLTLWQWLAGPGWTLSLGLLFDRLSALMLLFITGIGTLIHVYSVGYMWSDRGFARFMAYLNLFMFSMIVLVLGDSLPATFLGWEGVGLCSYLLIGFWHQDHANNDAARKAFIVNRVGDLGFLLGAFALVAAMHAIVGDITRIGGADGAVQQLSAQAGLGYQGIAGFFRTLAAAQGDSALTQALLAHGGLLTAATLLIFLGCTGKSAQIPLLTWLPDAMAGPTPVSALIHAATMVTSGVYLVARLSDLFVLTPTTMTVIAVIGAATAAWGAIAGLVQWDIKKILAYSTVSQLGFMFMAAGVGAFDVALFHVFTHAFFKATLFLGAGSVIHALHHEQDVRRMGGLAKALPITYSCMWFGWFAILGLPGGSGFCSKDLILERLFEGHLTIDGLAPALGVVALVTALLTAIYMSRMMYYVFWSPSRLSAEARAHVHESPFTMTAPLLILGFGAMIAGVVWFEAFRAEGSPTPPMLQHDAMSALLAPTMHAHDPFAWFPQFLAPVLEPAQGRLGHHAGPGHGGWLVMALGTLAAIVGWLVARWLYRRGPQDATVRPLAGFPAAWTFGFDRVYAALVLTPVRAVAAIVAAIDAGVVNGIRGLGALASFLGDGYATLQRGRLRVSLAISIGCAALLLAILIFGIPFGG